VTFRRNLYGPRLVSLKDLLQRLDNVHLTNGKDEFHWNLHENGKFSVASMYNALILTDLPVLDNKKIWKMEIPLKNKKIAWYLRRGVILTKNNFVKRNWHESKTCVFCTHDETIKLFFSNATLHVPYGQSYKQFQACIHQLVLPMSLEIGYMVLITSTEFFLGCERWY
jgi:hypothetical protein